MADIVFFDRHNREVRRVPAKRYKRISMSAAANHRLMDEQKKARPDIVRAEMDGTTFAFNKLGESVSLLFDEYGCCGHNERDLQEGI